MICRVVGSVQTLVAALVCIIGLLVGNKSVKQTYKGLAVVYWQIVRLVHNSQSYASIHTLLIILYTWILTSETILVLAACS